ncbi:hypothetical protein EGW08_007596 [Elysia chlorotica]|uniref:Uncharacterized protein n=1 Tax=Elysia chlorotica TaxID=188477 RepID=A0A433TST3_ELYCH|nr:hypothetical protein EGW08_007596 [Elysia chlorotica]
MASRDASPDNDTGGEVVLGWLHVWDLEPDEESLQGQQPSHKKVQSREPEWQPKFCELFCDERTLTFRDSEHDEVGGEVGVVNKGDDDEEEEELSKEREGEIDDSATSAPETKESTPVGCQSPDDTESKPIPTLDVASIILENPEESESISEKTRRSESISEKTRRSESISEKTRRSESTPAKRDLNYPKSKPPSSSSSVSSHCPKYEVRRSNSVPNAPQYTEIEHVARTHRLRRKISLTDKPPVKPVEKPERKSPIQRALGSAASRVNSTLKTASRKLEKQLENQEIRGQRAREVSVHSSQDSVSETSLDFADNPNLELFLPVTDGPSSLVNFAEDSESGISSPSQDTKNITSGLIIPSVSGNPDPNNPTLRNLRIVPPIIISAASVAATCVKLVRVRTRLDGGRDHFDTRWGYKARRRAAARRAALEKERQEREEREEREKREDKELKELGVKEGVKQEECIISEDGEY